MISANLFELFNLNESVCWKFTFSINSFIIQVIFSNVHPLHPPANLVCIIYILCQQSLHTVRVSSHNIANRKIWLQEAHMLFQGNSNCKGVFVFLTTLLVSQVWQEQVTGWKTTMCWLNHTHHLCMTNPFARTSFTVTGQETGTAKKDKPIAAALNEGMDFSPALKHTTWWTCSS